MEFKYFNAERDPMIAGLDEKLMVMLDSAREIAGVPFVITSGKRSAGSNSVLVGAVPDSSHLTGLAVDLFVPDHHSYWAMLNGLIKAGFRRIGHYHVIDGQNPNDYIPRHLHVDIDLTKPQDCSWVKREQN